MTTRRKFLKDSAALAVAATVASGLKPFDPLTDDPHQFNLLATRVKHAHGCTWYVYGRPDYPAGWARPYADVRYAVPVVDGGRPPAVGDQVTVWAPFRESWYFRGRAINGRIQHYSAVDYEVDGGPKFPEFT